jgi:uncharacterized membrane protein YgcG
MTTRSIRIQVGPRSVIYGALVLVFLLATAAFMRSAFADADPVNNAAAAFRTSRLVIDPAVASSISPADAAALRAKLDHATTPILIAVLPDSAVGSLPLSPAAVEATTYRLATTTAVPGTVGMILPQSHFFRATSSIVKPCPPGTPGCTPPGSPSGTADILAMAAAKGHGKQGILAMGSDFIASMQNAYAHQVELSNPKSAPKPQPSHSPLGLILVGLLGVAGAGLFVLGNRRSKQARRTGKTKVMAAFNDLGTDLTAHSALADSDDETRRNAYVTASSAYENAGADMAHAKTAEDWSTIGEIVAGGQRAMVTAKSGQVPSAGSLASGVTGHYAAKRAAESLREEAEPEPIRQRRRGGVVQTYYPAGSYMGRSWGGGWFGGSPWLENVIMYEAMEDLLEDHDRERDDDGDRGGDRDGGNQPDPTPTYEAPATPSYEPPPSYDPPSSGGGFDFGGGGGFDGGGGGGDSGGGGGGDW